MKLNWNILGGQGCKTKTLLQLYGYFLEMDIQANSFSENDCNRNIMFASFNIILLYEYIVICVDVFCLVESILVMSKAKRAKSSQLKLKSMSLFYNKVCELVSLLGDLVDIQSLTDTEILQVLIYSHLSINEKLADFIYLFTNYSNPLY